MKITMIAGSNRQDATSTRVLRYVETRLRASGVSVRLIDLGVVRLPHFSPDAGTAHPEVERLIDAVRQADGLVLGTPEYHGSVSGSLKNALDHLNNEHVAGKPVLAVSSAGGPLGASSLLHLQTIVRNLHGILCPEWISVGGGRFPADADRVPQDPELVRRIDQAVEAFVGLTTKLRAGNPQPAGATIS